MNRPDVCLWDVDEFVVRKKRRASGAISNFAKRISGRETNELWKKRLINQIDVALYTPAARDLFMISVAFVHTHDEYCKNRLSESLEMFMSDSTASLSLLDVLYTIWACIHVDFNPVSVSAIKTLDVMSKALKDWRPRPNQSLEERLLGTSLLHPNPGSWWSILENAQKKSQIASEYCVLMVYATAWGTLSVPTYTTWDWRRMMNVIQEEKDVRSESDTLALLISLSETEEFDLDLLQSIVNHEDTTDPSVRAVWMSYVWSIVNPGSMDTAIDIRSVDVNVIHVTGSQLLTLQDIAGPVREMISHNCYPSDLSLDQFIEMEHSWIHVIYSESKPLAAMITVQTQECKDWIELHAVCESLDSKESYTLFLFEATSRFHESRMSLRDGGFFALIDSGIRAKLVDENVERQLLTGGVSVKYDETVRNEAFLLGLTSIGLDHEPQVYAIEHTSPFRVFAVMQAPSTTGSHITCLSDNKPILELDMKLSRLKLPTEITEAPPPERKKKADSKRSDIIWVSHQKASHFDVPLHTDSGPFLPRLDTGTSELNFWESVCRDALIDDPRHPMLLSDRSARALCASDLVMCMQTRAKSEGVEIIVNIDTMTWNVVVRHASTSADSSTEEKRKLRSRAHGWMYSIWRDMNTIIKSENQDNKVAKWIDDWMSENDPTAVPSPPNMILSEMKRLGIFSSDTPKVNVHNKTGTWWIKNGLFNESNFLTGMTEGLGVLYRTSMSTPGCVPLPSDKNEEKKDENGFGNTKSVPVDVVWDKDRSAWVIHAPDTSHTHTPFMTTYNYSIDTKASVHTRADEPHASMWDPHCSETLQWMASVVQYLRTLQVEPTLDDPLSCTSNTPQFKTYLPRLLLSRSPSLWHRRRWLFDLSAGHDILANRWSWLSLGLPIRIVKHNDDPLLPRQNVIMLKRDSIPISYSVTDRSYSKTGLSGSNVRVKTDFSSWLEINSSDNKRLARIEYRSQLMIVDQTLHVSITSWSIDPVFVYQTSHVLECASAVWTHQAFSIGGATHGLVVMFPAVLFSSLKKISIWEREALVLFFGRIRNPSHGGLERRWPNGTNAITSVGHIPSAMAVSADKTRTISGWQGIPISTNVNKTDKISVCVNPFATNDRWIDMRPRDVVEGMSEIGLGSSDIMELFGLVDGSHRTWMRVGTVWSRLFPEAVGLVYGTSRSVVLLSDEIIASFENKKTSTTLPTVETAFPLLFEHTVNTHLSGLRKLNQTDDIAIYVVDNSVVTVSPAIIYSLASLSKMFLLPSIPELLRYLQESWAISYPALARRTVGLLVDGQKSFVITTTCESRRKLVAIESEDVGFTTEEKYDEPAENKPKDDQTNKDTQPDEETESDDEKKKESSSRPPSSSIATLCEKGGKKKIMEDRASIHVSGKWTAVGLFDGHGGRRCAEILSESLAQDTVALMKRLNADRMLQTPEGRALVRDAIVDLWVEFDSTKFSQAKPRSRFTTIGSTAAVVVVWDNRVIISINSGDSMIYVGDTFGDLYWHSVGHIPTIPEEQKRIVDAGGKVFTEDDIPRVGAPGVGYKLSPSRGFADLSFKRKIVPNDKRILSHKNADLRNGIITARPDVSYYDVDNNLSTGLCVLITTDGYDEWQSAGLRFVRWGEALQNTKHVKRACSAFFDMYKSERGDKMSDNVSVGSILVAKPSFTRSSNNKPLLDMVRVPKFASPSSFVYSVGVSPRGSTWGALILLFEEHPTRKMPYPRYRRTADRILLSLLIGLEKVRDKRPNEDGLTFYKGLLKVLFNKSQKYEFSDGFESTYAQCSVVLGSPRHGAIVANLGATAGCWVTDGQVISAPTHSFTDNVNESTRIKSIGDVMTTTDGVVINGKEMGFTGCFGMTEYKNVFTHVPEVAWNPSLSNMRGIVLGGPKFWNKWGSDGYDYSKVQPFVAEVVTNNSFEKLTIPMGISNNTTDAIVMSVP